MVRSLFRDSGPLSVRTGRYLQYKALSTLPQASTLKRDVTLRRNFDGGDCFNGLDYDAFTTSASGKIGTALHAETLAAIGGAPPYSNWSVTTGSLPAGVSMNSTTGIPSAESP